MTKQDFLNVIKKPYKEKQLDITNHDLNNSIIDSNLEQFSNNLRENFVSFLGFQLLDEELIKVYSKRMFLDYAAVFEDEDFEVFWFHTDVYEIYSYIDNLEIEEKEKEELKKLYPEKQYKNLEENLDIWRAIGMLSRTKF